jgi:hypothetical protein
LSLCDAAKIIYVTTTRGCTQVLNHDRTGP